MNLIMLRQGDLGKSKRSKVYTGTLADRDDIYVLLWERVCRELGCCGEVWWVGWEDYTNHLTNCFVERGVRYQTAPVFGEPSGILARGGYPSYRPIFAQFPAARRIFYAAGQRSLGDYAQGYAGILVDTKEALEEARSRLDLSHLDILLKPAPEEIFSPVYVPKEFDVVLISSTAGAHKGFEWASRNIPDSLKVLRIGRRDPWFEKSHRATFTGWITRREIPPWACKAKVCAITSEIDSNPRVVSEVLALNLPIVVRKGFSFSVEDYISPASGRLCSDEDFAGVLLNMVQNYREFRPRRHYLRHLSMDVASARLVQFIRDVLS